MQALNLFVNTRIVSIHSSALAEACVTAGDWCMTPVRCLLDGDVATVTLIDTVTVQMEKEYGAGNKPKRNLIRVIAAIILIVPGVIVGVPLKALGLFTQSFRDTCTHLIRFKVKSLRIPKPKARTAEKTRSVPCPTPQPETVPLVFANPLSKRIRTFSNKTCSDAVIGVYITTNEGRLNETRAHLSTIPRVEDSCHVGFSGWHNLDIIALRHSAYGLICDFNPQNERFMKLTFRILNQSCTREEFVAKMVAFAKTNYIKHLNKDDSAIIISPNVNSAYDFTDEADEIRGELTRAGSWLSNDAFFLYIKKLAEKDRIAVITEDIRHFDNLGRIAKVYRDNSIFIDTLYLSNIADYMKSAEDKANYIATADAFVQPETIVICCPERVDLSARQSLFRELDDDTRLAQHVFRGRELLSESDKSRYFKI